MVEKEFLNKKDVENLIILRDLILNIEKVDILDLSANYKTHDILDNVFNCPYKEGFNADEYLASYMKFEKIKVMLRESSISYTIIPIGLICIIVNIFILFTTRMHILREYLAMLVILMLFSIFMIIFGSFKLSLRRKLLKNIDDIDLKKYMK